MRREITRKESNRVDSLISGGGGGGGGEAKFRYQGERGDGWVGSVYYYWEEKKDENREDSIEREGGKGSKSLNQGRKIVEIR